MTLKQSVKKAVQTKNHKLAMKILASPITREEAAENLVEAADQVSKIYNEARKQINKLWNNLINDAVGAIAEGDPAEREYEKQFNKFIHGRQAISDGIENMVIGLRLMSEAIKHS